MNEHFGGGSNHPASNARRGGGADDDEYQRAIIESMKNARTGDITTEEELMARALEESLRN
jgi:hypothetical protein